MKLSISENKDSDPNMGLCRGRAGESQESLSWLNWSFPGGGGVLTGGRINLGRCVRDNWLGGAAGGTQGKE